jgi:hypothetical protein
MNAATVVVCGVPRDGAVADRRVALPELETAAPPGRVVRDRAIGDRRVAVVPTGDGATILARVVRRNRAVDDGRTAGEVACDSAPGVGVAMRDREPVYDRRLRFTAVEVEPASGVPAVDDAVVRTVRAADGDRLAAEVEVAVADAGVRSVQDGSPGPGSLGASSSTYQVVCAVAVAVAMRMPATKTTKVRAKRKRDMMCSFCKEAGRHVYLSPLIAGRGPRPGRSTLPVPNTSTQPSVSAFFQSVERRRRDPSGRRGV